MIQKLLLQWNLSKRTLRERDTVLNTSPQWTKPNPKFIPPYQYNVIGTS